MLLGLDLAAVRHVLVTRCIKAGGEFITKPNTASEASILRDSVTKAIYARLFDKLIAVINEALSQFNASDQEDMDISSANFIGAHRRASGRTDGRRLLAGPTARCVAVRQASSTSLDSRSLKSTRSSKC